MTFAVVRRGRFRGNGGSVDVIEGGRGGGRGGMATVATEMRRSKRASGRVSNISRVWGQQATQGEREGEVTVRHAVV